MTRRATGVQVNSIEATVNSILREWRDLWPGGWSAEEYSTLNLMALCRQGPLGYNHARCQDCRHQEWYASSCGNRHCPNCLGPRQAEWSEKVCGRLPDCPHFHVVFTVPEELHGFFEANYRIAADALFGAAAETLKLFQKNNWRMDGRVSGSAPHLGPGTQLASPPPCAGQRGRAGCCHGPLAPGARQLSVSGALDVEGLPRDPAAAHRGAGE